MWLPDQVFRAGRQLPHGFRPFEHERVTPFLAFAIVAMCILPLAFRRRWPGPTLAVVSAGIVAYQIVPWLTGERFPPSFVLLALMFALYSAAAHLPRRTFLQWGLPSAALVLLTVVPAWGTVGFWTQILQVAALMGAAAAFGDTARNRRAYLAEALRRAEAAERSREEEARRRVDEERLRIARELHDVTAHSLSIVAVQSGVALHVLDSNPEAARTALTAIRETSRASLSELRGMLGVLRASGDQTDDVPLTPTPGLAHIGELVQPLRDAGMTVHLVAPNDLALPAMVDASAYRIVQEALTNVMRHAEEAEVFVNVTRDTEMLSVEVSNSGPVLEAAAAEGHGIAGMRERALAVGGQLDAGPIATGGWRVAATLPVSGRSE
jgi:signal transduction histidine kinase